jgi:transitional endoplasmic reticulum ATPase
VNASVNVVRLVEALCDWRPGPGAGVSLCLYGRPGTGKSELVAYLAKRMARPLVARRVSDLVSMWLGETEQNIARAFEEAEQQGAVLLLDECDSFLRDRRFAHHSWERTQVNELLQQIEGFRGVVACTTNLFGDLDQAVLRRFVHKVEFFPLLPEQAVLMWDAHLARFLSSGGEAERTAIAEALRCIPGITPGDFAVVARRVAQLRGTWTAVALLRELETEVAARRGERRAIGFQE